MITKFDLWKLYESIGDGSQTFTQKLKTDGEGKNLSFYGILSEWGDEIDGAEGILTYSVKIVTKQNGIDSLTFQLETIDLDITGLTLDDNEDYKESQHKLHIKCEELSEDNITINITNQPFYLTNLDIDVLRAENLDGELDIKGLKIEADFGNE
jgi:hypothetical protein